MHECALRELKEETGLVAESVQQLCHLHLSNSITNEEGFIFVASGLTQQEAEPEESEVLSIQRLPFDQALKMALAGEITDAMSVTALLRIRLEGIA